jgi:hypothetical protein
MGFRQSGKSFFQRTGVFVTRRLARQGFHPIRFPAAIQFSPVLLFGHPSPDA